jgi:prophage regulatory protein
MTNDFISFLRHQAVLKRTGLKASTLYELISEGAFPKAVQLSKRCVGWREDQVNDWCRAKAEGREWHQPIERIKA